MEFPRAHSNKTTGVDTLQLVSQTGIKVFSANVVCIASGTLTWRRPSAGATYFVQTLVAGAVVPMKELAFDEGLELISSGTGNFAVDFHTFL